MRTRTLLTDPAWRGADGKFSLGEVQAAIMSNHSMVVDLLLPQVRNDCAAAGADLTAACAVIGAWDGRYDADSRGAVLFREFLAAASAATSVHPDGDGVFFVEPNGPGISKTAAGAGLDGYSFLEGQRRIAAKALFARFVVAQNVRNNFGSGRRGDTGQSGRIRRRAVLVWLPIRRGRDRHTLQRDL